MKTVHGIILVFYALCRSQDTGFCLFYLKNKRYFYHLDLVGVADTYFRNLHKPATIIFRKLIEIGTQMINDEK